LAAIGLPSFRPRVLAACKAALVRSLTRHALFLRDSRENVKGQSGGERLVTRQELDAGVHQVRDESDIAGQPVQLGNEQGCLGLPSRAQRLCQLGAIPEPPIAEPRRGAGAGANRQRWRTADVGCKEDPPREPGRVTAAPSSTGTTPPRRWLSKSGRPTWYARCANLLRKSEIDARAAFLPLESIWPPAGNKALQPPERSSESHFDAERPF
jgi:hypothetical protein